MSWLSNTSKDQVVITPSDTIPLANSAKAVILAVGGAVRYINLSDNEITATFPAGMVQIGMKQVYATGTTATGITGLIA